MIGRSGDAMAAMQAPQASMRASTARRRPDATGGAAKPGCMLYMADIDLLTKDKNRLSAYWTAETRGFPISKNSSENE
jgi:hypothetical protein